MSKRRKGMSLKDNEFTKDWDVEDVVSIDDIEKIDISEVSAGKNWGKRYPSIKPTRKVILQCAGLVFAVVLSVVCCFAFGRDGSLSAATVQAREETKVVTREYLSSMSAGETGVVTIDEKKADALSDKVSGLITDDMLKSAENGDTETLLSQIETGVADILKEDPEFTANLSDDDMENIVNSVSAIVKSELADTVANQQSAIKITASTTKNIDEVQANANSEEIVGLSNRITDTKGQIDALSQKVDAFLNRQDDVNKSLDSRVSEADSKAQNATAKADARNGKDGSDGKNGAAFYTDDALKEEISSLSERIAQMESDYETLSGQYASAKQSIAALEIAASGYADTSEVVAVSDSLKGMNETMQLQLSEIMNQIALLEANADSSTGSSSVSDSEYSDLKNQVSSLQKQLQDAADTVGKLMDMPQGSDLSTVLSEYVSSVEANSDSLEKQFDNFKKKVEGNERRYDSMYEDYNELLMSYKETTGNILSLSQILATKGDKTNLDALKQYSYDLYKKVIVNHNTVMKELYGDGYKETDPETAPVPYGDKGELYQGEGSASGTENGSGENEGGTAENGDGSANGSGAGGDENTSPSSKSIREQLSDLREDDAKEAQTRQEQIDTEKKERQQDISDVREDLKEEAEQTTSDIQKIFEQIWGIKPEEGERVSDNSQLLKDLDDQINEASSKLAELSGDSDENGTQGSSPVINSNSGSLQQAISNVISAYQTADNAIIDALNQESKNRSLSDKSLQEQIDALEKVVTNNNTASSSDTLAIKKAIATYVKNDSEHGALTKDMYIYYDGKGLEGAGFYRVNSNVSANAELGGMCSRTSVAEAIKAANKNVGELIKLLEQNEEFATRYKLK